MAGHSACTPDGMRNQNVETLFFAIFFTLLFVSVSNAQTPVFGEFTNDPVYMHEKYTRWLNELGASEQKDLEVPRRSQVGVLEVTRGLEVGDCIKALRGELQTLLEASRKYYWWGEMDFSTGSKCGADGLYYPHLDIFVQGKLKEPVSIMGLPVIFKPFKVVGIVAEYVYYTDEGVKYALNGIKFKSIVELVGLARKARFAIEGRSRHWQLKMLKESFNKTDAEAAAMLDGSKLSESKLRALTYNIVIRTDDGQVKMVRYSNTLSTLVLHMEFCADGKTNCFRMPR